MKSEILVTGASGNVGSRVVAALAARGAHVRAFVRNGDKARFAPGVEIVTGDYDQPSTVRRAMEGISRAYLLSTGPDLERHDAVLVDAAIAARVGHVVKHSVIGAQWEASIIPRWHRAGEKRLEASGLAWTHLRPATFASNALGWASTIGSGNVYGALGDAALPVIDPEDIAAVAAHVLTTPGHEGKAYDLTGPEALTTAQQVAILGEVIGRKLAYVDVPESAAREAMVAGGMPAAFADAMVDLIGLLKKLGTVAPSPAVAELLGRAPRTFRDWAVSNVNAFR